MLLICAATLMELQTYRDEENPLSFELETFYKEEGETAYLLTGVGIPSTLGRLYPVLQQRRPGLILNIGIAGAYPGSEIEIGDVVMGISEVYGDIGFEVPEEPGFLPIQDSPFGEFYQTPYPLALEARFIHPVGFRFHVADGCTVSTCTGTEQTGNLRAKLFKAGIESMEGAAVAQAGKDFGVPVCEVRAISNIASTRDMRPENIRLALATLQRYLHACRLQGTQEWQFSN